MEDNNTPPIAPVPGPASATTTPPPPPEPEFDLDKGVEQLVFTTLEILNDVIVKLGFIAEDVDSYLHDHSDEDTEVIYQILDYAHAHQTQVMRVMNKFIKEYKTPNCVIGKIQTERTISPTLRNPESRRAMNYGQILRGYKDVAYYNTQQANEIYRKVDGNPEYINRSAYNDIAVQAPTAIRFAMGYYSRFYHFLLQRSQGKRDFMRFSTSVKTNLKTTLGITDAISEVLLKVQGKLGLAQDPLTSLGTSPITRSSEKQTGKTKPPKMGDGEREIYNIKLLVVDPIALVNTLSKSISDHMLNALEGTVFSTEDGADYMKAIIRINKEILAMCGQVHRHYYKGVRLRGHKREQPAAEYIPDHVSEIPGESEEEHIRRLASALVHFKDISSDIEKFLSYNFNVLEDHYYLQSFYTPIQDALNTLRVIYTHLEDAIALADKAEGLVTIALMEALQKYVKILRDAADRYRDIYRHFSSLATWEGVPVRLTALPRDPEDIEGV